MKHKQRNKQKTTGSTESIADHRKTEPRGFRKIHIGTDVYLWRYYGDKVEIRTPHDKKMVVPIWIIQGLPDQEAWEKEHENDDGDRGYAYAVRPGLIRDYINAVIRLC